jgi:hypothetical protein
MSTANAAPPFVVPMTSYRTYSPKWYNDIAAPTEHLRGPVFVHADAQLFAVSERQLPSTN